MKNNLILAGILISLLGLTYYSEQIYKADKIESQKISKLLFKDFVDISEIHLESVQIKLKNKSWFSPEVDWPLSQSVVSEFLDILKNFQIIREIKQVEDDMFNNQKTIKILSQTQIKYNLIIGAISKLTGNFYVKDLVSNKVYLVKDNSSYKDVYSSELDLSYRKYNRLSLALTKKEIFLERNIFSFLALEQVEKIKINSKRNRNFEIVLKDKKITPELFENVKHKDIYSVLAFEMGKTNFSKRLEGKENILSDKRSEIVFLMQNGKQMTYSMHLSNNKQFGYYAYLKERGEVFELSKENASFFFINQQDFITKKINYNIDFLQVKKFKFKIEKAKKKYEFYVDDIEEFEIKSLDKRISFISKTHMNFLFNLVFNLADFKEAKYITSTNTLKEPDIKMDIFNKRLLIKIMKSEILVLDTKSNLQYHYSYPFDQVKPGFFNDLFNVY